MEFDAGYIRISWDPPFDNHSTISTYTLQLGQWNEYSASVLYEDTLSSPLAGTDNSTTASFVYGSRYYFSLYAKNAQGQTNMSEAASILCSDVPAAPAKLTFSNQALAASSDGNTSVLGIKWASNSVASGDSLTYALQVAVNSESLDWVCETKKKKNKRVDKEK